MGSWTRAAMKVANSDLVQSHRNSEACRDLLNMWNHPDFCTLQEQTLPQESWKLGYCKNKPSHGTAATRRIETGKVKQGAFGIEGSTILKCRIFFLPECSSLFCLLYGFDFFSSREAVCSSLFYQVLVLVQITNLTTYTICYVSTAIRSSPQQ